MKHRCPVCGHEYELAENTLPGCSECTLRKMVYPYGLSPKHKPTTAPANASYIADGVNPKAIYQYMVGGLHSGPSGCIVYQVPKYNGFVAVSYKPLGEIPGSGNFGGGTHASEFAVLVDLEGKSKQGPHLNFEDENHLAERLKNGEWIPVPNARGVDLSMCGMLVISASTVSPKSEAC